MDKPPFEGEHPSVSPYCGAVLLASVFLAALCGLVYELIAGTLSSYLLGDSVTQFSLVIGVFLTAMGAGSFVSKYITRNLLAAFVLVQIMVGLIGGSTALVGFAVFAYTDIYEPVLLLLIGLVGVLVGLEIPLLVRILRDVQSLRVTLANVLSADYVGALAASLMFPFVLLPHVGLVRAGLLMGVLNVGVAGLILWKLRLHIQHGRRRLQGAAALAIMLLGSAAVASGRLVTFLEDQIYQDDIILAQDSKYQRIVLTRWRDDIRLFLNGHLQFSSIDEYRYHEALVHPPMMSADRRESVLILGGGDGMAVREVAKYAEVRRIDVVDLDPMVTGLFRDRPLLAALNDHAFDDGRVTIYNEDAMRFLERGADLYDVVIMDLPDPSDSGLGKLYSQTFFNLVGRRLAAGGTLGCQATSPFRSRQAFWCIVHTLRSARCGRSPDGRFTVHPYHTVVPTFGTWGFVVAGAKLPAPAQLDIRVPTKYLSEPVLAGLFSFPADMDEVQTPISRLDDPVVCRLYRDGYHEYLD